MRELDANLFIHESDKAAMAALKAIPGFSQVMKAFMKIWNERQLKIINMSTNLRLSENQMAKYYNMLPPICEKLGIEVPELYVKLDVRPDAYTNGDTNPFIVVTSGLFETLPDELIPTVLAHECGHIACHHVLYNSMGTFIMNGASTLIPGVALYPIQLAYSYWRRCSELSADRAAALYDGNADKMAEVCMRFAGYDKDIMAEANLDLFMEQAKEYKELVKGSAWNKTLEFLCFKDANHPMNAVRAYEVKEWEKTERFESICEYLNSNSDESDGAALVELTPKKYEGKDAADIQAMLLGKGFTDITLVRKTDGAKKSGSIIRFEINGDSASEKDYYKKGSKIIIEYYEPKSEDEIALEHPEEILVEGGYKYFVGREYNEVVTELKELGFENVIVRDKGISKASLKEKPDNVAKILFDLNDSLDKKSWVRADSKVTVFKYTLE